MSAAPTAPPGFPELTMFIDGERVGVGHRRTHRLVNPATGATLGELPLADAQDLDRAPMGIYRLTKNKLT